MRSPLRFVVLLSLLASFAPAAVSVADDQTLLEVGDAFFRQGRANGAATHEVELVSGGEMLRVAIDRPYPEGSLTLEVRGPAGDVAARSGGGDWSNEFFIPTPRRGVWEIAVNGTGDYAIRAKLEGAKPAGSSKRPLLPNLRVVPPFDFSYTPGPGGCLPDEVAEHQATNCLRFAVGFEDAGDGALQLEFDPMDGTVQPGTMYQRIFYSDGSSKRRKAGTFEYHTTHAHYHHVGLGTMLLHRVVNKKTGETENVGSGPKFGFCMGEYRLADWWRFFQEPKGDDQSTCRHLEHGDTPTGAIMGLSNGWADVYPKNISGNYVEFSDDVGLPLPDGLYLITVETDRANDVLETNDRDNFGYALIEVDGLEVTIVERGRGRSPWDPAAVRVDKFHHDVRH